MNPKANHMLIQTTPGPGRTLKIKWRNEIFSCIWINGETSASYAWPQKCFEIPEILVLTFSFFGLLSIAFCIHSFIFHRDT